MLKENLLLENYAGHIEASEIEPSSELVYYLCSNALEIFNGSLINSMQCECGNSMNVYQAVEIPVDEFEELSDIVEIELYICLSCKKWKLDFIG
ncbi:hypothetical protein ACS51_02200 [Bacillus cereus]|uniref:hypothetical protein n=1 Tax=Bacillus pacificus TaxID=2026187 RepID=UPI000772164D|nr:hypothetical protein [Bacillus pacificus]KXI72208.1 hypothetical protein ACS51_02200 [Bacillus cereus]